MSFFRKQFAKTFTSFTINGKQYGSLEEVPEEFRHLFEDQDGDGRPDWIQGHRQGCEGFAATDCVEMKTVNGVTTYDINGQRYQSLDEMVGRVTKKIGKEDVLMVVSDHGFKPFKRGINLNSWLWKNGYLVCKSEGGSEEMFKDVDWEKTKAYALGLTGIYINLKGREGKGPFCLEPRIAP